MASKAGPATKDCDEMPSHPDEPSTKRANFRQTGTNSFVRGGHGKKGGKKGNKKHIKK